MIKHLLTHYPVARKTHQCWECTRPIERGSLYRVDHMVESGRAYSIKAHVECADAGMTLAMDWGEPEEGRASLLEDIESSGEPLWAFDLPDVVRRRLEDAIAEGEARDEARRAEALARIRAAEESSQ